MSQERLNRLRDEIEALDAELVRLMEERRALVIEVGGIKEKLGLPVMDPTREAAVVRRAATLAREHQEPSSTTNLSNASLKARYVLSLIHI